MLLFFFLFLLQQTCCYIELNLTSSRLTVRPEENAYAFGVLNNQEIDYFNSTIGDIKLYNHSNSINWVWKYKINYDTKNFTSIINIYTNTLVYTKKLNINILNYTPRITVYKNIIKADDSTIINSGTFIGNTLTTSIGNIITTRDKEWNWKGQTSELFKYNENFVVVKIWVDSSILNEFFIYKKDLIFNNIYYYLYIPNYVIEKDFIDTVIVNIATSHIFDIDQSKIVSKEFLVESKDKNILYYKVFKVNIDLISIDTALVINNNINNYIENDLYLEKIINKNINYDRNILMFEKPIIEDIYMSSSKNIQLPIFISLIVLIFIFIQFETIYMHYCIKSFNKTSMNF